MLSTTGRVLTMAILLVAPIATTAAAQNSEKVALITDVQGSVQVAPAGRDSFGKADWGTQLFEGDRVKTAEGAGASILFSNGNLIELGQNSSMTISGSSSQSAAGSKPVKTSQGDYLADASDLSLYRAGPGEIGALGGLRSGNASAIELETPRNTRIRIERPKFSWLATGEFDSFQVKVVSDDGLVWSGETANTSMSYPDDAPELVPGRRYLWQVEGEALLNTVSSPLVTFELLSSEEKAEVDRAEAEIASAFPSDPGSTSHLYVLGTFYAREGLLADAIDAFATIAEKHPDAARAYEILGKLYYDVDQKDDAVKALRTAVRLEQHD